MKKYELRNQKKAFSQKQPEKFGLLRRFLDWIARGVEESHKGRTYCPT